jgi:hypothetical protein
MEEVKKYTVSEEFLKRGYDAASDGTRTKLVDYFPEVFNPPVYFKIGKWYKGRDAKAFIYLKSFDGADCWGLNNAGEWTTVYNAPRETQRKDFTEATNDEVFDMLAAEANHRGFWRDDLKIESAVYPGCPKIVPIQRAYTVNTRLGKVVFYTGQGTVSIMYDGKWSEIIEDKVEKIKYMTIAEAEAILNCKIR